MTVPLIDLGGPGPEPWLRRQIALEIGAACRSHGFFCVVGHGVDASLVRRLESLSRAFFAQSPERKRRIAMVHGARAWRGYFAVGEELTSGVPDRKEGLYFGSELGPDHPSVRARTPMHGANLFLDLPGFRETVHAYMASVTRLGHRLMAAIALSLELDPDYFARRYTADPLILFRIFNYPAPEAAGTSVGRWGVGEHTDYGLLTLLHQDANGGLEVHAPGGWIDATPIPDSFVCNIGDMLDRMTRGLYRSTPHRVRASAARDRLSFPLFFDPAFHARVQPIEGLAARPDDRDSRWDGESVHAFAGSYGEYLVAKVSKVFPQLSTEVS